MRNHMLFAGLVLFGCYIALSTSLNAQEAPTELQAEADDFAEEVKQLNVAADAKARQQAIKAVLSKAEILNKSPSPLVSVIKNRKPKDVFHDLLLLIKADKTARHADFITPLVLAAYDAGNDARLALQAVKPYGQPAIETLCTMLHSTDSSYQVAAAGVAGERINGMAGLAKLVPSLIEALPTADGTVQAVAIGSLKKLTLLDFTTSEQWADWVEDKTALDIITEVGDREALARAQAEEKLSDVQAKLLAVTLERMRSGDRENAAALLRHLGNSEYLIVRVEAVKLVSRLFTKLNDAKSKPMIDALGQVLNDAKNPDKLRLACAEGLAEAHKSELSFKICR